MTKRKLRLVAREFSNLGMGCPSMMLLTIPALEHVLFEMGRKRMRVAREDGTRFWVKAKNHSAE